MTTQVQLAPLRDRPDYRVCADDTDPRGWSVVDADGVNIGSVEDLIIDLEGLTARYIVCALTRDRARAVLVPMGFVRIEGDQRFVHLDFVTAADVDQLPTFNGLPLSAELIAQMEQVLTGTPTTSQKAKIVRRSDETRNAS